MFHTLVHKSVFLFFSDVTQKPVALTDSNQQSELFILSSLSLNAALVLVVICESVTLSEALVSLLFC